MPYPANLSGDLADLGTALAASVADLCGRGSLVSAAGVSPDADRLLATH